MLDIVGWVQERGGFVTAAALRYIFVISEVMSCICVI